MKYIQTSICLFSKTMISSMIIFVVAINIGCSHVYTYSFSANDAVVLRPPVDLSRFFADNGLKKVPHEKGLYQMFAQREGKKLLEVWISEGTRVFEYWNNGSYEVIIEPWGDGLETSGIAKNLNQWIDDNPDSIEIKKDKDTIFQWQ